MGIPWIDSTIFLIQVSAKHDADLELVNHSVDVYLCFVDVHDWNDFVLSLGLTELPHLKLVQTIELVVESFEPGSLVSRRHLYHLVEASGLWQEG